MIVRTERSQIGTREPATTGAAGLDWLAIWRQMRDAEHAQTAAHARALPPGADSWVGKARRFAQAHDRASQPDAFMRFVLPHLRTTDTVLDIGAGAGRHALFLAQQVAQVIAVEPSPSMRQQLEARQPNTAAARLTVLPATWPDVTIPQCDIAICSHVLYGVPEVGPFIAAMDAAARRACFVLLGLQQPSFALAPFWERIHGESRRPLPGALECLNVLHQLGVPAQFALVPASHFIFAGREEALEDLRWRLALPEDMLDDAALLSLIDELLEQNSSGGIRPRSQPGYAAVLWWTHDEAT
jgi:SAM-dependent methyltransferase